MTANHYDVIVVGGGPAGVVAATQSARAGAHTLLIEKSGILGGTTTLGGVNFPGLFHAWGDQIIAGIGWELVQQVVQECGETLPDFTNWRNRRHWQLQVPVNIPVYAALADQMVVSSGAKLRLHTMPAAANRNGNEWELTVCGKEGLHTLQTRVLIDGTGDANLVALAGFPLRREAKLQPGTLFMKATGYDLHTLDLQAIEDAFLLEVAQGTMLRSDFQASHTPVSGFLRKQGSNAMHVPDIDAHTSAGKTDAELRARQAMLRIIRFMRKQPGLEHFQIEYVSSECGIRETTTIEGELCITAKDYTSGKVWPDSLCYSYYPIDIHVSAGAAIDTRYLTEGVLPTIPLRAQLPANSQNLIVAGRCACGDKEAHSAFRVQASAMAMGQVAGAAAALTAKQKCDVREVPLTSIRKLLEKHQAIVPPTKKA